MLEKFELILTETLQKSTRVYVSSRIYLAKVSKYMFLEGFILQKFQSTFISRIYENGYEI